MYLNAVEENIFCLLHYLKGELTYDVVILKGRRINFTPCIPFITHIGNTWYVEFEIPIVVMNVMKHLLNNVINGNASYKRKQNTKFFILQI